MNYKEKVLGTLNFQNMYGEGCVLETFFPWDQTVNRWVSEGLSDRCSSKYLYPEIPENELERICLNTGMTEGVAFYERELGFDEIRRMSFQIPFYRYCTQGEVTDFEKWNEVKRKVKADLERFCTNENIEKIYGVYRDGHERGDYTIRFRASGFFWTPRELMGIENHLYAFYDKPELMHDMNNFILEIYMKYLATIVEILQPEVLLFPEDLSGKNGPMISPDIFNEFVGYYYKKLFPVLRKSGAQNIFVDTDGDFRLLIPEFLKAGVDGFLPIDVNAGMDIITVRKEFPTVKLIGGFNKLVLEKNFDAIDKEFKRLMPVIRQGGYIPGLDHQATPDTPLENYLYYIRQLKKVMKEAGSANR